MTAITTAAAGNWSATGTWTGGVIPGNGDTVTLQVGHNVTVDDNRTVGASPAAGSGTAAILCNANLTIATGARLTCRGDVKLNAANVQLILNAGAAFRFDASQAGTPSTARYIVQQTGHNLNGSRLQCNGTVGSRCTIDSDNTNGGANGRFDYGGFLRAGLVDCSYTDFLRIGDATNRAIYPFWNNDADTFSLVQCIFDACGIVGSDENMSAGFTCRIDHVTMKNSVGASSIYLFSTNTKSGGLRSITDCVLDIAASLNCKNLTIGGSTSNGNLLMAGYTGAASSSYDLWRGNLVRDTGAGGYDVFGSVTNDYWLKDGNIDNPHFFQFGDIPDPTCDGVIFELNGGSATNGDVCTIPSPAVARIYTYRNCLCLPNDPGGESGDFISALGNANVTVRVEHNTYCTSNQTSNGAKFGETYNAHAGMCTLLKNNIAWHLTNGGHKITNTAGTPNTDVVTAANADYNCGWNLQAGSQGKGYNTPMSASPGVHDVDVNPQFVDSNRDIRTWDSSLGGPGTVAHALAELGKRNDAAGYNSAYTIQALWTYVRVGFAPTNPALHNTASDGTDIGAVPWTGGGQAIDSDYFFYQVVQR